jgi:hypothetical protein
MRCRLPLGLFAALPLLLAACGAPAADASARGRAAATATSGSPALPSRSSAGHGPLVPGPATGP